MLTIDGSYGEGGGQILRSALTLAAITGKTIEVRNIRASRKKPGLRPQHLTAVRALARICCAQIEGDDLHSQTLTFAPQCSPQAGTYTFDVATMSGTSSAGSTTLILQAILLPLALADDASDVTLRGGTVVPMSPPAPYIEHVYLPTLFKMGIRARLDHPFWGFYPRGGGELRVEIAGKARLLPLRLLDQGDLIEVTGDAFVAQLPSHIPQRMSDRVRTILRDLGFRVRMNPQHVTSTGIGAGLFLCAHYERALAGFSQLGRKGLPSEEVADLACRKLVDFHRTRAAVDAHLGDQLVVPLALAPGTSRAVVSRVTRHLLTNVWLVNQFELAPARVEGELDRPGTLIVGE